jgi:enediyne biosynthesis protein E4
VKNMPSSNVVNYIFSNNNGLTFSDKTEQWGLNRNSNSNGAAYADFDNDGDLDLVVNNINAPAFLFENNSPKQNYLKIKLEGGGLNTLGIGAKVLLSYKGKKQFIEQMPARGYLSAVSPVLHAGLGETTQVDSLIVQWPGGKTEIRVAVKANSTITFKESDAKNKLLPPKKESPIFTPASSPIKFESTSIAINDFKRQPSLITQFSSSGPLLIKGDVNGDGREDIFAGGGNGAIGCVFVQNASGKFLKKDSPAFEKDKMYVDADAEFADVDNDGDADLYLASGGYHNLEPNDQLLQDRLYINDGKGGFTKSNTTLPAMLVSKGCVAANDIDSDGDIDFFVGGRVIPGRYPETPKSFMLINDGKGNFKDDIATIAPGLQQSYMVTDALWVDLNGDQAKDLAVVGEWMPISVFNNYKGRLQNNTKDYFESEYFGWWTKLESADLNHDGKFDLIAGNFGLNSQYQTSATEPIEMFYNDFDNNGSVDPILCTYIQGKRYPYMTRDELLEQLGYLRPQFNDYKSYANATVETIFKPEVLAKSKHLHINHLETTYFQQSTANKMIAKPLPLQSQFAPVHSITIADFNTDGHDDILLAGNMSKTKLKIGKIDSNYGVLLAGDGRGSFSYVPQTQSGLKLKGDIRNVIRLGNTLLFPACEGALISYSFSDIRKVSVKNRETALLK